MTRPTPASMPAVDRTVARAGRLQNLDDLADEAVHVYRRFRNAGIYAEAALTLTEITLTRKA